MVTYVKHSHLVYVSIGILRFRILYKSIFLLFNFTSLPWATWFSRIFNSEIWIFPPNKPTLVYCFFFVKKIWHIIKFINFWNSGFGKLCDGHWYQFGCGILKMEGPKKHNFWPIYSKETIVFWEYGERQFVKNWAWFEKIKWFKNWRFFTKNGHLNCYS